MAALPGGARRGGAEGGGGWGGEGARGRHGLPTAGKPGSAAGAEAVVVRRGPVTAGDAAGGNGSKNGQSCRRQRGSRADILGGRTPTFHNFSWLERRRAISPSRLGFPVGHCQPSGPLHRSTPRHRRDHHHHPGRAASTIAPPLCRLAAIRCCGRPPISYSRPPPSSFPPLRPSLRLTLGPFHST